MMEEEKPKGFLEELQSLDDAKKRRILIIATIVIMVIVITVWFAYFNGVLAGAAQSVSADDATSTTAQTTVTAQPVAANGPSLWQNIENGIASIGNIFRGHSDYQIQPK